ncbi:MAG: erythromycin esterase family protein [Phycisphaerales bacterium]|nr:erythromycin esterase family protein [Phycisphaerales bacterium]
MRNGIRGLAIGAVAGLNVLSGVAVSEDVQPGSDAGGGGSGGGAAMATADQLLWLRDHAVKLDTVEAGNGFKDLQPLKAMIGDAQVVGLGEGTHGTREFFRAKHRLLEFLVEEMGFSIFSIEANMPEAYALNGYVMGGEGEVEKLIGGMYFWTWNTEDVRDMVEWMRAWNAEQKKAGSGRRVQFTGFDMQTERVALEVATDFLREHDRALLEQLKPGLARLKAYSPHGGEGSGNDFGCATGRFPVEEARGKKVRYSGWVKCEDIEDGWAGLWWRVDGPTRKFDNMQDRGPRGTKEWQEFVIELDVPADAEDIYFGLLMPGRGRAWFDGLKIEIDGKPWESEEFDLDFEGDGPKGLLPRNPMGGPASPGYSWAYDAEAVKHGKKSFRVAHTKKDEERMTAEEALAITGDMVARMEAQRDRYAAEAGAWEADWAIQNARVVDQWAGLGAGDGYSHRDKCMAINARWILEQNPDAKMVIWAHNWHVRDEMPWMGAHLRKRMGPAYVNLAFCSSKGEYWAVRQGGKGLGVCTLAAPEADSFEAVLEATGEPILLVDLREAKADDPGSAWLTESRPFGGIIGAMEMPRHYQRAQMQGPFDLLLYVRETTWARPLGK